MHILVYSSTVSPEGSVMVVANTSFDLGQPLLLQCTAEGGPENVFSWTRINPSNDVESLTVGMEYQIPDLQAVDGGNYECRVSNTAGAGSEIITVTGKLF